MGWDRGTGWRNWGEAGIGGPSHHLCQCGPHQQTGPSPGRPQNQGGSEVSLRYGNQDSGKCPYPA